MGRRTNKEIEEQNLAEQSADRTSGQAAMSDLESDADKNLATAIRSLGGVCRHARLYRRTLKDPKWAFVDILAVEGLDEDSIGREYGGGDYRINFVDEKGQPITNKVVKLDPRIRGARDLPPETKQDTTANDALLAAVNRLGEKSDQPSAPTGFIELMQIQAQAQAQAMQAQQAQFAQIMAMMQQSSQNTMTVLAEAFKNRPQETKSPLPELMGLFMPVVLEMIRKKTDGLEDVERIARIKELFSTDEKPDMLDKIIKYGGPLAAGLMSKLAPPQEQQVIVSPPPSNQAPQTQSEAPNAQMQAFLSILWVGAKKNSDPAAYATMIEDGIDEVTYTRLIEILQKDDWFTVLFGQMPQFLDHKEWLAQLREDLLDPGPPDEDSEPTGNSTPTSK